MIIDNKKEKILAKEFMLISEDMVRLTYIVMEDVVAASMSGHLP